MPLPAPDRAQRLAAGLLMPAAMAATPWWLANMPGVGCLFRSLTGVPCPLCGGTHACAAFVQGEWAAAWAYSPGAVGVLVWMVLVAMQCTTEGLRGARRLRGWPWVSPLAIQALMGGLLLPWLWRLATQPG